jgi:Icc-related predicted phosphoesterase
VFSARPRSRYRILAVSDKVEPRIYGPNLAMVAANIDFVVACGDLPYYYLEYIISVLDRPLYYVHGNHDRPEHRQDSSLVTEPPGGINLHRRVRLLDGLLIAGLQGSHRYNQNPHYQYTQTEMRTRVIGMMPELLLNRIRYGRALDLLVTHSPPFGIHDAEDRPHVGFQAFHSLLRWFRPRYMLHGHQHVYSNQERTTTRLGDTEIINVYPFCILELDFAATPAPPT